MRRIFLQSLKQLIGIPLIHIKNGFHLPSKNNYICKTNYILPFEGKWTVINGSVDKALSHSWGIPTQRYAYDFIILDKDGKSFQGDPKLPQSYYCYGKNIIAPAYGEVIEIYNECSDNIIEEKYNLDWNIKDIRGNFIIIRHVDGEYSFIAHIMQNSFVVAVGDKVKQGQIIANCGNTGNSSEPHLHFHLQNGKSFFTAAGLPVCFNNVDIHYKENYELYDNRCSSHTIKAFVDSDNLHCFIFRGQEVESTTVEQVNS